MKPTISVLICSYNAEKFIENTIQSVLAQTYQDFELLILDNNSSDNTRSIINSFCHPEFIYTGTKVPCVSGSKKILNQVQNDSRSVQHDNKSPIPQISTFFLPKNIGPYAGLNYLLDKAKGRYIAINDHDDVWHPEKLEKQVRFLENNEKYVGCGSGIINWYEKYNTYFYRSQPEKADVAWHTSLLFRNDGYRYDLTIKVGTDFYFMKNILSKNKKNIYNFREPFVLRKIFKKSENLSGNWMKKTSFWELMRLHIGFIDRLALLNRLILPQELVEWVLVKVFANNIPEEYINYF